MTNNSLKKKLMLQAKIDCAIWMIEKMRKEEYSLSPINRMIDESTGFYKEKLKRAKSLIKSVKKWKKEFWAIK